MNIKFKVNDVIVIKSMGGKPKQLHYRIFNIVKRQVHNSEIPVLIVLRVKYDRRTKHWVSFGDRDYKCIHTNRGKSVPFGFIKNLGNLP